MSKNYVYLVKCKSGQLYCGWTVDIDARVKAHNEGKGAKFTKGKAPIELVYLEEYESKSEALKREAAIKKLSREAKVKLCDTFKRY